jgi:peptide/nickel transport system permease protein
MLLVEEVRMGLTVGYVVRRLFVFLIVIWAAASLNFVIPRLAPGDPVGAMLGRMSLQGASIEGSDQIIAQYRQMFGLDDSLPVQYVKYLRMVARLELGYSLSNFPVKVMEIIQRALPWTIGLLTTATLISFTLGTLLGALLVWRGTPRTAQLLVAPLMIFAAIPYYLLAIVLLYLLAFGLRVFPIGGITRIGAVTKFSVSYILDIVYHSTLPALSIVLAAVGGWMLGMRGMMVTVIGSDFLTLAQAKGLKGRRIFLRYAVRNAILPQITALAISLGHVVSGAVLVEIIFSYPGIGFQLYRAISNADYTMIQGITFILVLSVAIAILILDLLYPRLDPRITYARR